MITILFIIMSISIFSLTLVGYKKYRSTTLYALAIGGAVNANFFHSVNYPIYSFDLPFGLDSILYTLFAFCVILMLLKEDRKAAYLLAISSIIAIMFSACMQLLANILSVGNTVSVWESFGMFTISSIASLIAISAAIEIIHRLKGKLNEFILIILGMTIICIINGIIYFPLFLAINGMPENALLILLASFIGKTISTLCALGTLVAIHHIEKKKNDF